MPKVELQAFETYGRTDDGWDYLGVRYSATPRSAALKTRLMQAPDHATIGVRPVGAKDEPQRFRIRGNRVSTT